VCPQAKLLGRHSIHFIHCNAAFAGYNAPKRSRQGSPPPRERAAYFAQSGLCITAKGSLEERPNPCVALRDAMGHELPHTLQQKQARLFAAGPL
jgi:hypothetical protein